MNDFRNNHHHHYHESLNFRIHHHRAFECAREEIIENHLTHAYGSVNVTLRFVDLRTLAQSTLIARRHILFALRIGHHRSRSTDGQCTCVTVCVCVREYITAASESDNMQQSNSFGQFESKTRQYTHTHMLTVAHTHARARVHRIAYHDMVGITSLILYESNLTYMGHGKISGKVIAPYTHRDTRTHT